MQGESGCLHLAWQVSALVLSTAPQLGEMVNAFPPGNLQSILWHDDASQQRGGSHLSSGLTHPSVHPKWVVSVISNGVIPSSSVGNQEQ